MVLSLQDFARRIVDREFPITWPGHYCDAAWLPVKRGVAAKSSANPNTGDKLIEVSSDKETIAAVIEATVRAKSRIGALSLPERLEILRRFRQTLADYQAPAELILRLEAGKPKWEAQSDYASSIRYLDWVAASGEEIMSSLLAPARLTHEKGRFALLPIGPTAAYLPFSTPITSFVVNFAASTLAACPLLMSCSSHAMLSGLLFGLIAQESGVPASMLNVIFGNFSSFKQVLGDRRIAAGIYTGSREHCDTIRAESRSVVGRQLILQSGGKNAVVVHSSADIDHAVKCVAYGALTSSGQRCTSTSRVFVDKPIADQFIDRLVAAFKNVRIGRTDTDAPGEGPFMGPLYSEKAVEKFLRFQTMANRESEKTLLWGRTVETEARGNFVTPSLHYLGRFDNQNSYQGNVLFSPDVAIYDYEVLETAIECINTTDAAFAVSFIGDQAVLEARRHLFLAPNLLVNKPTVELETTLPLAGRLQSGHHRFHGASIALYLCYPQVMDVSEDEQCLIKSWPWPAI
jgi:acyl-CoA reductase-like NAD-dependent aldehyde dehydrogenase